MINLCYWLSFACSYFMRCLLKLSSSFVSKESLTCLIKEEHSMFGQILADNHISLFNDFIPTIIKGFPSLDVLIE